MKRHLLFLVTSLGVLAAACTSGGGENLVTYTDPANLILIEVPSDWHIYPLDQLTALGEVPFTEDVQGLEFPVEHAVAFDGAPASDVGNLATDLTEASFPIGAAVVRSVGQLERDFISRYTLTQSVLPYLNFTNPRELSKEDFSFGNGYEGVRVLVAYTDTTGQKIGVAYIIAVTDEADQRIFSVVAGCSRDCFVNRQQEIESVVDSWLVNTRV